MNSTNMSGKALDKLIHDMHANRELRVRSLIITFFGDAIVPRGGAVSLSTIQLLMQRFDIEAGAVRTALSRLASDQWVIREMQGRNSFYRLAPHGHEPFKRATRRIYAATQKTQPATSWSIAIGSSSQSIDQSRISFTPVAEPRTNVLLFDTTDNALLHQLTQGGYLVYTGKQHSVPTWLLDKLIPESLPNEYRQLQKQFAGVQKPSTLKPLDAMAARCLLIHNWRRILLRTPELPASWLPDDWPVVQTTDFVRNFYHALLPASSVWLDTEASGPDGPLWDESPETQQRFY